MASSRDDLEDPVGACGIDKLIDSGTPSGVIDDLVLVVDVEHDVGACPTLWLFDAIEQGAVSV